MKLNEKMINSTGQGGGINSDKIDDKELIDFYINVSYYRNNYFKATSPTNRTTINTPSVVSVVIDNQRYSSYTSYALDTDDTANWDDTTYATPENRAGKDFYIYACIPVSGNIPVFILSANSTYPTGYTASNSRKIGGFHCLCVSVGASCYAFNNSRSDLSVLDNVYLTHDFTQADTSRHWLKNYIAGDILPFSIWDLSHKPKSNPEGMVYDANSNLWVDIYLPSYSSGLILSKYQGTILSGISTPIFHGFKFSQQYRAQRKKLLTQYEFESISLGSPQGVNILGSANPGTTGGRVATNNLRIISNIGVEDVCGVYWQWGEGQGIIGSAASWIDGYDANDLNVAGKIYLQPTFPIFGGNWDDGVLCGSRVYGWDISGLSLNGTISGRGSSLVSSQN